MKSILITPKSTSELKLIVDTLQKLGIRPCLLSEDEKEDIASALMMRSDRLEDKALVRKLYEE